MLFDNNDYIDMIFNVPGMNYNNYSNNGSNNVLNENGNNLSEGFLRGNMFDNEFKPYKNMEYIMPKLTSAKEKALAKIMESAFEIVDYNLYLDVHPEDMQILNLYNNETEKLKKLKKDYEMKYGPLSIECGGYDSFKWINSPWPWEKEDGKYV